MAVRTLIKGSGDFPDFGFADKKEAFRKCGETEILAILSSFNQGSDRRMVGYAALHPQGTRHIGRGYSCLQAALAFSLGTDASAAGDHGNATDGVANPVRQKRPVQTVIWHEEKAAKRRQDKAWGVSPRTGKHTISALKGRRELPKSQSEEYGKMDKNYEEIVCEYEGSFWGVLGLLALMNLPWWASAIFIFLYIDPSLTPIIALSPFILFFGIMSLIPVKNYIRAKKFANLIFRFDPASLEIGGSLSGFLSVKPFAISEQGFLALFSCTKYHKTRGSESSVHSKTLWQNEKYIHLDRITTDTSGMWNVPVFFDLPTEGEIGEDIRTYYHQNKDGTEDWMRWYLEIKAQGRGLMNYDEGFELSIFKKGNAYRIRQKAPGKTSAEPEKITTKIRIKETSDGILITLPFPGWLPWWTLIITCAYSVSAYLTMPDMISDPTLSFLRDAICIMTSTITLLTLITLYFYAARKIRVSDKTIRISYGPLGLRRKSVPCADVDDIRLHQDIDRQFVYYDIYVHLHSNKKKRIAAYHLKSMPEAEWLVRQLKTSIFKEM